MQLEESSLLDRIEEVKEIADVEESKEAENFPAMLNMVRHKLVAHQERQLESPFMSISWSRWQEMQAQLLQYMARVARAIELHEMQIAVFSALDMQDIVTEILKEASLQMTIYRREGTRLRKVGK